MPWKGEPPSVPNIEEFRRGVVKILDGAGDEILKDQRRASPSDTGALRKSWKHFGKRTLEHTIQPTVPYHGLVEIDPLGADLIVDAVDEWMNDLDPLFKGQRRL